jgi:hypothetical protein
MAKSWIGPGLLIGEGLAAMFFPDTCEIGVYRLTAGQGPINIYTMMIKSNLKYRRDQGKWPVFDYGFAIEIHRKTLSMAMTTSHYEGGAIAAVGGGVEYAMYVGPGEANADAFAGVFTTLQVSFAIPQLPVGLGASIYVSEELLEGAFAGKLGSGWIGGTLSLGFGAGGGTVRWDYSKLVSFDLDKSWGTVGKCLCVLLIANKPSMDFGLSNVVHGALSSWVAAKTAPGH